MGPIVVEEVDEVGAPTRDAVEVEVGVRTSRSEADGGEKDGGVGGVAPDGERLEVGLGVAVDGGFSFVHPIKTANAIANATLLT
jgi:hypothetical protein